MRINIFNKINIKSLLVMVVAISPISIITVQEVSAAASTQASYNFTRTQLSAGGQILTFANVVDKDSNVYVAGIFSGTVSFDGTNNVTSNNSSGYITKYSPSGAYLWTRYFDTGAARAYMGTASIAVDSNSNVYITGSFFGTVVFDDQNPAGSTVTTTSPAVYITKISSDNVYGWTKTIDIGGPNANGNGESVTLDKNDNIYLASQIQGSSVTFDGPGGVDSYSIPNTSTALTKYSSNGTYLWTKFTDTSSPNSSSIPGSPTSIKTDSNGNIFIAGTFTGTVIFDGVGGVDSKTSSGDNATSYLSKFDNNGVYQWTKTDDPTTNADNSNIFNLVIDSHDNVYLAGYFLGTDTFDGPGGHDTVVSTIPRSDISALTKYDNNGTYLWTKTGILNSGTTAPNIIPSSIAIDAQDHIYTTGLFTGSVNLSGSAGNDTYFAENPTGYVSQYNSDGVYNWTKITYTGAINLGNDIRTSIAFDDNSGNFYVSGFFSGVVTFDGPTGSDTITADGATWSSYLSSYHLSSVASPPLSPADIKAPNTGMGLPENNLLSLIGLILLPIALIAVYRLSANRRVIKK